MEHGGNARAGRLIMGVMFDYVQSYQICRPRRHLADPGGPAPGAGGFAPAAGVDPRGTTTAGPARDGLKPPRPSHGLPVAAGQETLRRAVVPIPWVCGALRK